MLRPFYQTLLVVLQIRMQTDGPRHNDRERWLHISTGRQIRRDGFIVHLTHLTLDSRSANPPRKKFAGVYRRLFVTSQWQSWPVYSRISICNIIDRNIRTSYISSLKDWITFRDMFHECNHKTTINHHSLHLCTSDILMLLGVLIFIHTVTACRRIFKFIIQFLIQE